MQTERRHVAVLYADLCGSTKLSATLEPELYAAVIAQLHDTFHSAILKAGGTLLQIHGDGVLAMFGYPNADEQDFRNAVRGALELHGQVRGLTFEDPELKNIKLRLHTGVDSGTAVVVEGDIYGGRYQLRGEVTNQAAYLSDVAGEDEILVNSRALIGGEPYFELGEPRLVAQKSGATEITATPILANNVLTAFEARQHRSQLPFQGRNDELQFLRNFLNSTSNLLFVSGSPGAGKSTLIGKFLGDVATWNVRITHCEQLLATPLQPFTHLDPNLSPGEEQAQSFALELSREKSILFIDDWQWADDASISFLAQVIPFLGDNSRIVIATRMLQDQDQVITANAERLELSGFSAKDAQNAVIALRPDLDIFATTRIMELAGGNPLFIEELCRVPTEELTSANQSLEYLPEWLYGLIQSRFDQLSGDLRAMLNVAAVCGPSARPELISELTGSKVTLALSDAVLLDLIQPPDQSGAWTFKHALVRDVVYDLIPRAERRLYHAAIADRLMLDDAASHPAVIAYHLFGSGQNQRAATYAIEAGDLATRLPSLADARTHYRAALEALDLEDPDDATYKIVSSTARKLSATVILDPSLDELPILTRILDLAKRREDTRLLANAHYWVGAVYYGMGQPTRAIEYYQEAVALAEQAGHERLKSELKRTIAQAHATAGNYDVATKLLHEALNGYETLAPTSELAPATAYTLGALAMLSGDQGDFSQSGEYFSQARRLVAEHPTLINVISKEAAVHIWRGDWQSAQKVSQDVSRLAERMNNTYIFGTSRVTQAFSTWCADQDPKAKDDLVAGVAQLERSGHGQFLSLFYAWVAYVSYATAEISNLRTYAAKCIYQSRIGDHSGLALAYRSLALGIEGKSDDYLARADAAAHKINSDRERALNAHSRALLTGNEAALNDAKEALTQLGVLDLFPIAI